MPKAPKSKAASADTPPKKRGRPPKAKSDKPAKEPKAVTAKQLKVDPEKRRLFLIHKESFKKAQARLATAQSAIRNLGKTIKGDGFKVSSIKDSILFESPEGEAQIKAEIADRLLTAKYTGSALGNQLDLFLGDVDRTPATDLAYDEGARCSMENRAAIPPYGPETEQYRRFMEGFHDEQERILKVGIAKKDQPEPIETMDGADFGEKPVADVAAALPKKAWDDKPKDAGPPRTASVTPITRATLGQQRESAKTPAESHFKKREPASA